MSLRSTLVKSILLLRKIGFEKKCELMRDGTGPLFFSKPIFLDNSMDLKKLINYQ